MLAADSVLAAVFELVAAAVAPRGAAGFSPPHDSAAIAVVIAASARSQALEDLSGSGKPVAACAL
jgi:hypothetical protein